MRLGGFFLAVLLCVLAVPAQAVRVPELFRVELPVQNQSETEKQKAFSEAMRKVLIKISGRSEIVFEKALQRPIRNPNRYVQQLAYEVREVEIEAPQVPASEPEASSVSDALLTRQGPQTTEQLWLLVDFYPDLIESLLRDNGLPVWGSERPATLVWLARDNGFQSELVSSDLDPVFMDTLLDQARQTGLPVLLPLYDLEDTELVNAEVVSSGDLDPLLLAATRYSPEAMLVGQLLQQPDAPLQAEWTLVFAERASRWKDQDDDVQALLQRVMQRSATVLAQEYAVISSLGETPQVELSVEAISDIDDYQKVVRYLQQLQVVESLQIEQIQADKIRLQLQLQSGTADFQRLVSLGSVLEQIEFPQISAGVQQNVELFYSLIP